MARLSLPGGWLHTEINVRHRELNPDTVTHPSTNYQVWCGLFITPNEAVVTENGNGCRSEEWSLFGNRGPAAKLLSPSYDWILGTSIGTCRCGCLSAADSLRSSTVELKCVKWFVEQQRSQSTRYFGDRPQIIYNVKIWHFCHPLRLI